MTRDQQELVRSHIPNAKRTVYQFTRKFAWLRNHVEDLQQEAMVGLCEAALEFDPARGVKFITFALPRMEWKLQHAVDRNLSPFGQGKAWRSVPRGTQVDVLARSHTQTPERIAMLNELALKLRKRTSKMPAITRDIYRTRVAIDRACAGDGPLVKGSEENVAAGYPALGKKHGFTKQRAQQLDAEAEGKIRAWGRSIDAEAA